VTPESWDSCGSQLSAAATLESFLGIRVFAQVSRDVVVIAHGRQYHR
jgi:hypothetical protein